MLIANLKFDTYLAYVNKILIKIRHKYLYQLGVSSARGDQYQPLSTISLTIEDTLTFGGSHTENLKLKRSQSLALYVNEDVNVPHKINWTKFP